MSHNTTEKMGDSQQIRSINEDSKCGRSRPLPKGTSTFGKSYIDISLALGPTLFTVLDFVFVNLRKDVNEPDDEM
jgi:hypothetical protein